MTKFRRTQEDKLKRVVDLHLQYAERQKKILEANKTRHNYLHIVEQRNNNNNIEQIIKTNMTESVLI